MVHESWFEALRRRWSALLRWISRPRSTHSQTALPQARDNPSAETASIPARPAAESSTNQAPSALAMSAASASSPSSPSSSSSSSSSSSLSQSAPSASVIVRAATAAGSGVMGGTAAAVARVAKPAPTVHIVERAAEPVQVAPPRVPGPPVTAALDAGLDQMSVRMFFSRLLAATPEGLTIDFARWETATVERFFLAITSPGLIRRREAPTTGEERLTLPTAFDGFEWD